jgi:hypothetical protein
MRRYQPSLLGGLFIGILSALPVVGFANLCCCLWVIVGGVLTAYLQQQDRPEPIDSADAALGGVVAGLIGASIYLVISFALFSVSGDMMEERIRTAIEQNPQIPADLRDSLIGFTSGPSMLLVMAAVTLPIYAVASTLGALLGAAIFRRKTPPPTPSA